MDSVKLPAVARLTIGFSGTVCGGGVIPPLPPHETLRRRTMKLTVPSVLLAMMLFSGCLVTPERGESGLLLVPPLPSIVVLDGEPYYQHGGYHYFYRNDRWSYAHSRTGPWVDLPRDRYPKEVRYKVRNDENEKGENRGHGRRDGK
jgi:hypothetical protein